MASARRNSPTRARLAAGQPIRSEERSICSAVGPEEFARARQVRHAGDAADLHARYAGQGLVRHCPSGTAATAACGSRMPSSSPTMLAQQEGHARQVPAGDAEGRGEMWSSCQTEIPVRLLYQTAFWDGRASSSGPTSTAGTTTSRRRSGSAAAHRRKIAQPRAARTSGRRTNEVRAPSQARRPHPPPNDRAASFG